jgi:phosphohistidine phosphatase
MHSELHLLRHAKSSWDRDELADFDRPLTKRGRRAGGLIAAHLREAGIEPDAVIYSPAVRAEQTFGLVRAGLPDRTPAWHEPRIYGADWEELLEVVRELPPELSSAMLIGHNPGIQGLAETIAGSGAELQRIRRKYPTGALATLRFETPWNELRPGVAELTAFVRPKQLAG